MGTSRPGVIAAALAIGAVVVGLLWLSSGESSDADGPEAGSDRQVTRFDVRPSPAADVRPTPIPPPVPEVGRLGLDADGTDPETVVTCAVDPPLDRSSVEVFDDALPEIPEVAVIADGVLTLAAPRAEGTGVLKVPGHVPMTFAWADGRCTDEPLELVLGGAAVVGTVANANEEHGLVQVVGCGTSVEADADGGFFLEAVPGRTCTLVARRVDGIYTAESAPVEVTPVANVDQVVDLELPAFPTAGIGAVLTGAMEGLAIETLVQDGPASRSGLQRGDIIVSIDGEDAAMLGVDEADALLRGEPGTAVELEVQSLDGRRTLELERATL